jgi:hypothetical protein
MVHTVILIDIMVTATICPLLPATGLVGMKVLRNNRRTIRVVWKEFCYGKAETLEDAEEAARGWRYNLVRSRSGLRCCDVGWCGVVVTIRNNGVVCKIMG